MGEEEAKPTITTVAFDISVIPASTMKPSTFGAGKLKRPAMLKRTSSMGDERKAAPSLETPLYGPSMASGWPQNKPFDFLGEGSAALGLALAHNGENGNEKPCMPGTPVKKNHFVHPSNVGTRVGHSMSQPYPWFRVSSIGIQEFAYASWNVD